MSFLKYIIENSNQIFTRFIEHVQLVTVAVFVALFVGVFLGIIISYYKKSNKIVLSIANLVQAIPSMALLGFAVPFLGIGHKPAVIVVILYSLLPIIKNTYTGLESINSETLEAARAIGLTKFQILFKIKLPLALPVIMAGVRISAVTAVGLMTMAAFIGGGGLGYLVFAGIRTVNHYQILAGAIPACLLALFVDYLGAIVENLVMPKNTSPIDKRNNSAQRMWQKTLLAATAAILMVMFTMSIYKNAKPNEKYIAVGCKDYTEQVLLCHLVSEAIEANTNIYVQRKEALGSTQVVFGALQTGDIDLYVEYSGTAYGNILQHEPISDVNEVYKVVKQELKEKYSLVVLDQMQLNNTWTLAIRPDTATKYNLKSISDLARISHKLKIAAGEEFLERTDGLPGLSKHYRLSFGDSVAVSGSLRFAALENNSCEVIDAFATEGLLKKYSLVVLKDDQQFFLPYYAMPVIRQATYDKYPEIVPVLNRLGQLLTNEAMIALNYEVDELQKRPEQVAREFLQQQTLMK